MSYLIGRQSLGPTNSKMDLINLGLRMYYNLLSNTKRSLTCLVFSNIFLEMLRTAMKRELHLPLYSQPNIREAVSARYRNGLYLHRTTFRGIRTQLKRRTPILKQDFRAWSLQNTQRRQTRAISCLSPISLVLVVGREANYYLSVLMAIPH